MNINSIIPPFDYTELIMNKMKLEIKPSQIVLKEDLNKLVFSNQVTENDLAKKSFVEKFLNSIKEKMYSNR